MRLVTARAARFGLLVSALWTASSAALAQDPAQIEQAKKHMEAGAAFYNDPAGHKCEEAYREFKTAFELSGSANALKAMGVCALELERDGDAIAHFEKFMEKTQDKGHPDRAQVDQDLKALKSAVAWVTLKANKPGARIADVRTPAKGYLVTNRYVMEGDTIKLGVHPGSHLFTATVDGMGEETWKVEIANGSTQEYTFDFKPGVSEQATGGTAPLVPQGDTGSPAPTERPIPPTVFIFGGLTLALTIPTVIFMVRASGLNSDYDEANGNRTATEDMRSDVKSANLLADIFLGVTAASLAATAVFYFTRPTVSKGARQGALGTSPAGRRHPAAARDQPSVPGGSFVGIAPRVSTDGGGAWVTGRF